MATTGTMSAAKAGDREASSWWNSFTLRQRILLLLCFSALPGMVVAVFLATNWLHDQSRQIEITVDRLAKLAAARHDTVIENARTLLAAVAQGYVQGDIRGTACRTHLSGWLKEFPAFTSLTLYDEGGVVVCTTSDAELPFQAESSSWFKEVRDQKQFVMGQYMIGRSGQPLLAAAFPIVGAQDQFKGAVALGIDLRWLDFLAKTINLPDNATITALNDRGELLSHNAAAALEKGAEPGPAPSHDTLMKLAALTSGTVLAKDASDSPRVYGVQKTASGNVIVAVGRTPYLGFAYYREALVHTLAAPLLVLLLALIAAAYASEAFVTRYVRSLARTVEAIQEGDLSARTDIPYSKYEIGRLASALDSMADSIEKDQEELEHLVQDREMLLRELNHRVKNNLQTVLSMIRLGSGRAATPEESQALLKSLSGRVHTLAQIHQLLYESYESEKPPLGNYVQQLTRLLGEFYETRVGPAQIEAEVGAVDLTIGQCITFGLILNELVANAQKHAFQDGRPNGRIGITILVEAHDNLEYVHLIVSDNGVGLPPDFDLVDDGSTGSRIVRGFAKQLHGEIWGERLRPGTAMHLRFPTRPPN